MICIYHNRDLDGFTSAAIVKRKYPDAKLIGYDYNAPIPWDEITPNVPVIMIDVSFKMPDMLKLAVITGNQLTWIDHHKSTAEEYTNFVKGLGEEFLTQVYVLGKAACEIGWEYLFPNEPIPYGIQLIADYDVWRNINPDTWNNHILPFQYGMRLVCSSPETFPTELFDCASTNSYIQAIKHSGQIIIDYQKRVNALNCKKNAFEMTFHGLRAICLNTDDFSSQTFESVYDESKHDIMIPFQWMKTFWKFSLYTTKEEVDCSKIASIYGGGGHQKAAGFERDNLDLILSPCTPQPQTESK